MVKRYPFLFIVLSWLVPVFSQAATQVSGVLSGGQWDYKGSPYLLQGSVTVSKGTTLEVGSGAQVVFQGQGAMLIVEGGLEVKPSATYPAVFNMLQGGWQLQDFLILNGADAHIANAKFLGGVFLARDSRLSVQNCDFTKGSGLCLQGKTRAKVLANRFYGNSVGMRMDGPQAQANFEFNTFSDNTYGLDLKNYAFLKFHNNIIRDNAEDIVVARGKKAFLGGNCWEPAATSKKNRLKIRGRASLEPMKSLSSVHRAYMALLFPAITEKESAALRLKREEEKKAAAAGTKPAAPGAVETKVPAETTVPPGPGMTVESPPPPEGVEMPPSPAGAEAPPPPAGNEPVPIPGAESPAANVPPAPPPTLEEEMNPPVPVPGEAMTVSLPHLTPSAPEAGGPPAVPEGVAPPPGEMLPPPSAGGMESPVPSAKPGPSTGIPEVPPPAVETLELPPAPASATAPPAATPTPETPAVPPAAVPAPPAAENPEIPPAETPVLAPSPEVATPEVTAIPAEEALPAPSLERAKPAPAATPVPVETTPAPPATETTPASEEPPASVSPTPEATPAASQPEVKENPTPTESQKKALESLEGVSGEVGATQAPPDLGADLRLQDIETHTTVSQPVTETKPGEGQDKLILPPIKDRDIAPPKDLDLPPTDDLGDIHLDSK